MAERIALVALGRSPLPTGKTLLQAELAEDVDLQTLDAALAARDVEVQVLPAPAQPREAPETTVAPVPLGVLFPTEPDDTPLNRDGQDGQDDEPAPSHPEYPEHPVKDVDVLAGKSDDEVRRELEEAAAIDAEVKELVEAKSRPELVNLARREKATHGASDTKPEIALEIVEKRRGR